LAAFWEIFAVALSQGPGHISERAALPAILGSEENTMTDAELLALLKFLDPTPEEEALWAASVKIRSLRKNKPTFGAEWRSLKKLRSIRPT
jgi:hypothetical protein